MQKTLNLRGAPAVVVLALIAVVAVARFVSVGGSLETEATQVIRTQLVADYARQNLPELQQATTGAGLSEARINEIVGQLSSEAIEFVSISGRGHDSRRVVRVEIQIAGAAPPDGEAVRYFEMEHSMVTGWRIRREVGSWKYYLTL